MTHYEEEVGPDLAARFHREFEEVALQIERNPRRFHIISGVLQRMADFCIQTRAFVFIV